MKTKIKRFLSMALALIMVFSSVPATVLAEDGTAPALPTATVTPIENEDLTFALNFKADETTEEQLTYYGDWYADFVLTVNQEVTFNADGSADGFLSGQYDGWSENWVDVPFEDVTLKANESLKIMEYASTLMEESGLKYTYAEVYESVKDFDCGVYFDKEFTDGLTKDFVVTLELRVFNPADETESYVIGETYTFTIEAPELPTATVTEIENEDLTFALNFKADEATEAQLAAYGDWYTDFELKINQDVTFNANGGANGYLSGQYDEWSENWVNVPFEDVTLKANEALKIMAYAAESMGESGLKYTYGEVYDVVKDFDCGVYFTDEFLAGLTEDLVVTLELCMYNPENETERYVIGETYEFVVKTPPLPTATVTEIENEDLTFALNFVADPATEAQLAAYGDWYADYVLTVNKDVTFNANGGADGYLSGQYDEWSENWVNVPFEDVTLKANESLKIMEYAAELMDEPGLKYTYGEVYEYVKDFDCGVFFEEEFLLENMDLEVTLELRMYNPEDESESYVIGDTYVFTLDKPELPTATVREIENDDLTFALNFVADPATNMQLAYYGDWYADYVLTINKDVTFNANGEANGFLSGQYDEWSENWVNVPFEDVTLKANESLKIMEYAAELMGEPGLKYTYAEVYEYVKDFDCGVFFEEEFLLENMDLEVTLELRMYNPADESESYVIGDTYTFTIDRPELPTATVTEIENDDLTFALNFVADKATKWQQAYYGDWYADFELTVNQEVTFNANGEADGHLSGQYDEWSENWVNVPFEEVTLPANTTFKIMEYAAELMGEPGLKYTYGEVYEFVKDFDCGVFFGEEFVKNLKEDLVVTLELRMYNPDDETENYAIGQTYVFVIPVTGDAVVMNVETKVIYSEVMKGLNDAEAGQRVILLKDVDELSFVMVPADITFDLNGHTLGTNYYACYGDTVDYSDANTGLLVVPKTHILMQKENEQLPVIDNTGDVTGYRFFEVLMFNEATRLKDGIPQYVFQPLIEEAAHDLLVNGAEATGVTINARLSWTQTDGQRYQDFVFTDDKVDGFFASYKPATGKYGMMFTLLLKGTDSFADLEKDAVLVSDTGVEIGTF